jgi:hypothetical protein
MSPTTNKPVPPEGSIEFELTDFDDARRALDELPAGLAEMQRLREGGVGGWEGKRRRPLPSDRALTGETMDWLIKLPPALRPQVTCEQFPRVANAVAHSWDNLEFSLQVIDHMINDYRGGRRGFPPSVQQELKVLHEVQRRKATGLG